MEREMGGSVMRKSERREMGSSGKRLAARGQGGIEGENDSGAGAPLLAALKGGTKEEEGFEGDVQLGLGLRGSGPWSRPSREGAWLR